MQTVYRKKPDSFIIEAKILSYEIGYGSNSPSPSICMATLLDEKGQTFTLAINIDFVKETELNKNVRMEITLV